ncbi:MAG: sigma-54-dependent Fis family transcriptional regulator [Methylophaga sp.]|uniref:sigma-54-dependent transcriptional regulator n=1 Tax=Methylophaga sp. UBA678 TaxID=1946901 RepID=UPI000C3E3E8D|nr:sigma-54 dependent transcriptional regulator [Methylophaga sp. UBA678]MAX53009.1 sigma-54-dependent Fis family transcriptional regulator [Methylophaga sp.]|tara:strand:+ start:3787 stop:5160 length:1374 start_codon:yes stop_codon:yes gene_type:complete
MLNVLLVEDETLFAKSVLKRLQREGHTATVMETITDANEYLEKSLPDVILLDVRLPDASGLDFLQSLRAHQSWHAIPVIMMTAYGELEDAVQAMKLGATDYLKKPVDLDELVLTLNKVMQTQKLSQQLDYSHVREAHGSEPVVMIGHSSAMHSIKQQMERIIQLVDRAETEFPIILINGETGTGKDVLARYYHQSGKWCDKPFVHVDCAALPKELIEAELFGYERGAFTNAHQAKAGLIEVAEAGTVFLDEIGELPIELQSKLLNVLERRQVRRIGATQERPVSAHFIAATNRDLPQMVADGEFRSDLYFRLNVIQLQMPPLRERKMDIAPLAAHFVAIVARRYGLDLPVFTETAVNALEDYHWPGNIRELQHVVERAVMMSTDGLIDIPQLIMQTTVTKSLQQDPVEVLGHMTLEQVEKYLLEKALERTAGNVSRAARELGLTRMAMRYRMEKYQL